MTPSRAGNLTALMFAAFVDMMGVLMVIPLLPFVATRLGAGGFVVGALMSSFSLVQLLSAPLWGRMSDRYGRRPVLLTALTASAAAYLIFAWASLPPANRDARGFYLGLLFLSRIVQGAGGGTVGVIQAYVADSTEPRDRARALGWLSAATNLGVSIGPVIGSWSLNIGPRAPGVVAAAICVVNVGFVWRWVRESHQVQPSGPGKRPAPVSATQASIAVATHPTDPAPRLIWIYAIAMGAFMGVNAILALFLAANFGVTEKTIGYFFAWNGGISVLVRAFLLGWAVDRFGEARLARIGQVLLGAGLLLMPVVAKMPTGGGFSVGGLHVDARIIVLGLVIALVPLGTAFTFPCVTGLLSQVIDPAERGVMMGVQQSYGGAARVLFPLLAGWTYQQINPAAPFWTSAALVLATLFLSFGIGPRPEEPRPAPREEEPVAAAT